MKYIIFILAAVTILHEVNIYRLNRKVDILIDFFNEVMQRLKEVVEQGESNVVQRFQRVESDEQTEKGESREGLDQEGNNN